MAQRTLIVDRPAKSAKATTKKPAANNGQDRERIFEAFRRWGFLQADLDPLGLLKPLKYAELDDLTGAAAVDPRSVLGAGDVKYHVGATGTYVTAGGQSINVHIVSNPSHLEAVDPVAMGRARAKQTRHGADGPVVDRSRESLNKVWPIVMH